MAGNRMLTRYRLIYQPCRASLFLLMFVEMRNADGGRVELAIPNQTTFLRIRKIATIGTLNHFGEVSC